MRWFKYFMQYILGVSIIVGIITLMGIVIYFLTSWFGIIGLVIAAVLNISALLAIADVADGGVE